ncbi:hypothetical protein MRB53_042297 [Persea americana]|nr:hypothetical protein MRB53_042297 [Persea americana]
MNDIGLADIRRQFEQFCRDSNLDVALLKSDADTKTVINAKTRDEWQRLAARQTLFFETNLKSLLPSLELTASAHATNAVSDSSNTPAAAKYEIASHHVEGEYSISKVGSFTQVVWSQTIHLVRPNGRLQRPAIYFTAILGPSTAIQDAAKRHDQRFFKSYEAQSANVLASLKLSDDAKVHISEARITKVDGEIVISAIEIECQHASVALLREEATDQKLSPVAKLDDGTLIDIDTAYRAQIDVFPIRTSHSAIWKNEADITTAITQTKENVFFSFSAPRFVDTKSAYHVKVQCINQSRKTRHFAIKPGIENADSVLIITPHVRLGPIEPGACFESSIQCQAVAEGVQQFGTVRIIDLDSKLFLDVIDLPDIIVSQST